MNGKVKEKQSEGKVKGKEGKDKEQQRGGTAKRKDSKLMEK